MGSRESPNGEAERLRRLGAVGRLRTGERSPVGPPEERLDGVEVTGGGWRSTTVTLNFPAASTAASAVFQSLTRSRQP
jgi:hypothetical protein